MSMCNVLGVLGDDEPLLRETLAAAVALADAEHSRLTLAKTCEPGRSYVWVSAFAAGGLYVPAPIESPEDACRLLARTAELVPEWIPVTTLVLEPDTGRALRKLLRAGRYDALVAPRCLLAHRHLLCRELRRQGILALPVKTGQQFVHTGAAPGDPPRPTAPNDPPRPASQPNPFALAGAAR